jgi:hypothetical protein
MMMMMMMTVNERWMDGEWRELLLGKFYIITAEAQHQMK